MIGKDIEGNFLVAGDGYFEAVKRMWSKIMGSIHAHPTQCDRSILDLYSEHRSWNWPLMLTATYKMLEEYLRNLKHTGLGKDGIHNCCWNFGSEHTNSFLVCLTGCSFCGEGSSS